MYQGVLGAAITVPAAVVLPNTGDNTLLTVTAIVTVAVGAAIIVTSVARTVVKKAHKA
ncbi:MAG TPA: LPXTG cell wall anchor domain-containing protein [Candidatus Saccharimonadales bacterium]|nr:LPXTG cell wall anchor domain-containing protein [Candidatus Saccharimonadales bacterium]